MEAFRKLLREEMVTQHRRMDDLERVVTALHNLKPVTAPQPTRVTPESASTLTSQPLPSQYPLTQSTRNQQNSRGVRCYECNRQCHYARNCITRRETAPEAAEETTTTEEPTFVNHVQGSTFGSLPVNVHGKSTVALIDTGSEMSLSPSSLVRPADIRGSVQHLRAANGTEIRVLGEADLECQAGEFKFTVPCLVTEQLSELIIG